ncbi:SGNH/GDSL hydrolase family protein [uncultured Polaribacter sp.]|uniref:SGNH/GDSL hydrolase family protein n=1 Tax=uncultured Polaribacter sp. TaxID=174711 RepID=UPI002601AD0A|nr:SGNH/GDSL hydrolase family protein [uncultured Polaribacter sp.]
MNNLKIRYFLGVILAIPLLPLLYFQGKKIRKKVPKLPEARLPKGFVNDNFSKTLNIITIGESTIAGVGVDIHENGFTGALANQLSKNLKYNIAWQVYAKSGYTAKRISTKIIPEINKNNIDIIVIGIGGNDAFKLNSPKKWNTEVERLIKNLQKKFPKAPVYFTNMPPIKEFPAFTNPIKFVIGNLVEIFGKHLSIIIKNKENVFYNAEVITLKSWSKRHNLAENKNNVYFSDGVHPSKLTYKIWGKEMANFIKNNYFN